MFLFLLLFIGNPSEEIVYCDRVIHESFYRIDNPEKLQYKELLFYEQDPSNRAWYIRNYHLLDDSHPNQSMTYIYRKVGDYHVFTLKRDKGKIIIKTKIYLEVITVAEKDLEVQNKSIIEEKDRNRIW